MPIVSLALDLYSHVAPDMATDAATKVAALILGTRSNIDRGPVTSR